MVTKLPSRFLWKAARKADSTSAVGDLLLIIVPRVESGKITKRAECPARVACTRKALTREPCREACIKSPPTLMDAKSDLKPTHGAPAWSSLWYIDIRITNGARRSRSSKKEKCRRTGYVFAYFARFFASQLGTFTMTRNSEEAREYFMECLGMKAAAKSLHRRNLIYNSIS